MRNKARLSGLGGGEEENKVVSPLMTQRREFGPKERVSKD